MADLPVKSVPGGVTFAVRVTPRAHKSEIVGVQGDALKVKLAAPPVEGAANAALCAFLADQLGVRRNAVTLMAGQTSRQKVVRVEGMIVDEVQTRLDVLMCNDITG
jgi:uncharacterized protein (TIGR00251 family)